MPDTKKAVIIGASSGIGEALVYEFAKQGYEVAMTARRLNLLEQISINIKAKTYVKQMDISRPRKAVRILTELIDEMGYVDAIVVNSGIRIPNKELDLGYELNIINTNVRGFAAMASTAVKYFLKRGKGNLVGISSIAGLRGSANSPSYNASKSFVSVYMNGLRQKCYDTGVYITDIRPGFVKTAMTKNIKTKFWTASTKKAAAQIYKSMKKKKNMVYITKRWNIIALLIHLIPNFLYYKIYKIARPQQPAEKFIN